MASQFDFFFPAEVAHGFKLPPVPGAGNKWVCSSNMLYLSIYPWPLLYVSGHWSVILVNQNWVNKGGGGSFPSTIGQWLWETQLQYDSANGASRSFSLFTVTPQPASYCQSSATVWTKVGSYMLGRGQTFKRWEEAQDICLCENALLVMDKSKEVHDFLQKEGKLLEGLSFKHIFTSE